MVFCVVDLTSLNHSVNLNKVAYTMPNTSLSIIHGFSFSELLYFLRLKLITSTITNTFSLNSLFI